MLILDQHLDFPFLNKNHFLAKKDYHFITKHILEHLSDFTIDKVREDFSWDIYFYSSFVNFHKDIEWKENIPISLPFYAILNYSSFVDAETEILPYLEKGRNLMDIPYLNLISIKVKDKLLERFSTIQLLRNILNENDFLDFHFEPLPNGVKKIMMTFNLLVHI